MANVRAVKLIKEFESFSAKPYRCIAGVLTIGWGRTEGVTEESKTSMAAEHVWLCQRLDAMETEIRAGCKVETNDNQMAAFLSLAYNIGTAGFKKSTVLRQHNLGSCEAAAKAFELWDKAVVDGVKRSVAGLLRRRKIEAAVYLEPVVTAEISEPTMPQQVEPEKPLTQSVQINAGSISTVAGVTGVVAQIAHNFQEITDGFGAYLPYIAVGLACVAAVAAVVVVIERMKMRDRGEA